MFVSMLFAFIRVPSARALELADIAIEVVIKLGLIAESARSLVANVLFSVLFKKPEL